MKFSALAFTLLIATSTQAANLRTVLDWNPEIPTTPSKVLELVKAEAEYFSYETDDSVCGGEVTEAQLTDYRTFSTDDGNDVHTLTLRFRVSKSENYCQSETQVLCEVQLQVLSQNGIVMDDWNCK